MAILARATFKENSKNISLHISLISSLLKSLSPAGKKLTPMLAILAQGVLFSSGITVFGINFVGLFISISLSSLWTYLQPLLILYIIFGKTILSVLNYFKKDFELLTSLTPAMVINILIATYVVKVLITFFISRKIIKMTDEEFVILQNKFRITHIQKDKDRFKNPLHNALIDLFQPVFIISLLMTGIFLYYSEGDYVVVVWLLLRPF